MTPEVDSVHPDAAAIREHVDAVVASPGFARSKKLAGFLRWVVERALAGETNSITERNIGLLVYGRPSDFDPKIDGTVRAEAIRLRHKLREFYASTAEPRRIDVPKGSYIPMFSGFEVPADLLPPVRERALSARFVWTAGLVLAIVSVGLWLRHTLPTLRVGANEQRAAQLTNEAIRLIRIGNNIAAADCSREAVTLAPKDARSHRVFSRALMDIGHVSETVIEAHLAESLAEPGSDEELQARAQRYLADGAPVPALAVYQQLAAAQPKSFDLLFYLLQAQLRTDPIAALSTIERARQLPEAAESPELDRMKALALGTLAMCEKPSRMCPGGQPLPDLLPRALAAIRSARAMALAGRVKPAEGRILLLEGGLEANSGLRQESIASLKRAHEICLETHDDICVAGMLRVEGNRRIFSNEYGEALRFYDRALPLALRWQNSWEAGNILEGIELASERLRTLGDSHKLVSLIAAERPVAQFR